jgi:hypothetical protein
VVSFRTKPSILTLSLILTILQVNKPAKIKLGNTLIGSTQNTKPHNNIPSIVFLTISNERLTTSQIKVGLMHYLIRSPPCVFKT